LPWWHGEQVAVGGTGSPLGAKDPKTNIWNYTEVKKGIHKQTRKEQKKTNFKKIKQAIEEAKTIKEAIKKVGLSRRTFYKYYKEIKREKVSLYFKKIKEIITRAKNNCMFTKSIHLRIVDKINKKELHFIKIKPITIALNDINTNKRRQTCKTKQHKW